MTPPADPIAPRHRTTAKRLILLGLLGLPLCLCLGLAVPGLRLVGVRHWRFDGPSMQPTYQNGDRFVTVASSVIARGDVVAFESPADGVTVVKRVIAIGGDEIGMVDDVLFLNGVAVPRVDVGPAHVDDTEEPVDLVCYEETVDGRSWRITQSLLSAPESMTTQTVPMGSVFVMGDHRDRSNDSRNPRVGMIPLDRVHGRVDWQYAHGTPELTCP